MSARRQEPVPPPTEPDLGADGMSPLPPLLSPQSTLQMEPGVSADISLAEPGYDPSRPPTAEEIERIRAIRKPMGSFSQKLELAKRPGYFRHWFNDLPGRVEQALASGWAHVRDRDGKPVRITVGRSGQGGGQLAYAMELPEIFWREDMALRNSDAKSRMDALKASPFQARAGTVDKSDAGKFYTPQEALEHGPIQITTGPGQ